MNPFTTKTVRRVLLGLACTAALTAAPLIAQDSTGTPQTQQQPPQDGGRPRGGDMQERQIEHLTRALNLTPDQVSQVKAIQVSSRQQMMALHSDTTTAPADRHARMMSLRQTEQSNIRAILSDEQKAKFDTMQAKMRERRETHQQGEQAPPPPPPPSN
jgi:protein CpxP